MLDNETKRRIFTARDILVGVVPNPISQVEQITIALIYKFMDDMDTEAVEFGGKASFFVGEFEKYSWKKIFDPKLGGYEMLTLYSEAIERFKHNESLPLLFRRIFQNAYLSYRNPETLKLFLKTINEFTYEHSERLGDAFEYLLSILGSQGDAGMFRTPRNIIDFIVQIVDPKKNETICDPACGTAGFLISSYKHILKANTRKIVGDRLTPEERKNLMENIVGYDLSPDMVRFSLVNMYLHTFPDPHIHVYDTLSQDDRWNEYFDVIMANPPFMSPKGGIKPHKKFSIQANRSEVLFVDYIAEHINPSTGRAGIIVPEGIIFQSATAYKSLRKMLVDKNFLYAVVSLPAGVFNPYSGVKTSILLMDKQIAAKTDKILFVKIQNDGFGLGAQRREIKENDLPAALDLITNYKLRITNGESLDDWNADNSSATNWSATNWSAGILPANVSSNWNAGSLPANVAASSSARRQDACAPISFAIVPKSQIAANGEYNLSGDRYRTNAIHNHKFETVELGEVLQKVNDNINPQEFDGKVIYVGLENIESNTGKLIGEIETTYKEIKSAKTRFKKGDILYGKLRPNLNKVHFANFEGVCSTDILVLRSKNGISDTKFYSDYLRSERFNLEVLDGIKGAQLPRVGYEYFSKIKIPLPPLGVQSEIVEKIESFQRIIDGAKQVVENYKPQIDISPDWETVELGEVCVFDYGKPLKAEDRVEGDFHVFGSNGIVGNHNEFIVKAPFIVIGRKGSAGAVHYSEINGFPIDTTFFVKLENENKITLKFLYFSLLALDLKNVNTQAGVPGLNRNDAYKQKIPLPSLEVQQEIVTRIEREQALVDANKELVKIFEQKIKDEINKLWN